VSSKYTVNIIGAGISGLATGLYLQMNGFKTEIFEKQSKCGGLCTSWQRGEYTFDGCLHWLLGSYKDSPFYKIWKELIDIDKIEFENHKIRVSIELKKNSINGNKIFCLYTNINQLEEYMTGISPEDIKVIKKFTDSMRQIQKYEVPPLIDDLPFFKSLKQKTSFIKLLPFLFIIYKWKNITNYSFAKKFKSAFLKEAFELLFGGEILPLLVISFPLAFFDKSGAGYPLGGSYKFSKILEEQYISKGGKVNYNSGIKEVITKNNIAQGLILENDKNVFSDFVVSAADWHYTVFNALNGVYINKTIQKLKEQKKLKLFYSVVQVSLGLNLTLNEYPHFFRFPLDEKLISPDGSNYEIFEVHIYNYDKSLAPEGKTVVTMRFYTKNGNHWINLRNSNSEKYKEEKKQFAVKAIDILNAKIEGIKEKIEQIDVATPASYFRYTNNLSGSIQGWLPKNNFFSLSPVNCELPGLKNFYMTGHWIIPGGGLPVAIKTARDISQKICRKSGIRFKTN